MKKKKALFISNHNSARSQIAEALLESIYGDFYSSYSSGPNPKTIHPNTISVLKEINIDISGKRAKNITEFEEDYFDYVVTLCDDKKNCPIFLNCDKLITKTFKDPISGDGYLSDFREIREEIRNWIIDYFKIT